MFGTVAAYRAKPGKVQQLLDEFARFDKSPPPGWVATTVYQSTSNPDELWMSVVFESEDVYRRNADNPEMDARYRRILEFLASQPEWHDGEVLRHATRNPALA